MNDARAYHTFAVSSKVGQVLVIRNLDDLKSLHALSLAGKPWLCCGEGSNLLFVKDYDGTLVVNRLRSRRLIELDDAWVVEAAAGENWHELVRWLVSRNVGGLENLALIPGSVGAAPVQNIGAYGAEFSDFCQWVEIWDSRTQQFSRLSHAQCQFGYRSSIFKTPQMQGCIVTRVGISLSKHWQPNLSYGSLQSLDSDSVSISQVFDMICQTRTDKLPDPKKIGNAGSFFKNPIVDSFWVERFQPHYKQIPIYPLPDGTFKVAAGWLIDQCALKGFEMDGAGVHVKQALVLTNASGNASGAAIARLASYVQDKVYQKFAIKLEPEVLFIGTEGFVNPQEVLSNYAKS
ncbi:UDP-N-acetylmuramate dehydrogenase [Celerinatantimonas sp. MCCC 1A17872]|uniref:UDP-N-acetylmuramate dehydrogenase n=1 Tax=Celerinatantimonas sp. MCCC 1A17872 TaxID=3177514 RepID=UPI0038C48AFE